MRIPPFFMLAPNRVWRTYLGGRQLDVMENKPSPGDSHFPEDWIASTTRAVNSGREQLEAEGLSTVTLDGENHLLRDVFMQHPREMLGERHLARFGPNTQFLLKLLDSAVRLHIQCHPTLEFARTHLGSNSGKTEAYVILGSREDVPHPYIHLGFQHVPDRQKFRRAIEAQDTGFITSCFEKIPVRPGDVFIVPGGVPHAIGEGILMIELMEPTDFAVRIEFERGGYVLPQSARFMGRDLDFALSMFTFREMSVASVREQCFLHPRKLGAWGGSAEFSLVDKGATPCFRLKKLQIDGTLAKREDSFYAGIVTGGSGRISSAGTGRDVSLGERFLVPYSTEEVTFESTTGLEVVYALPAVDY